MNLLFLPECILQKVFLDYLKPRDLLSVLLLCKEFHSLIKPRMRGVLVRQIQKWIDIHSNIPGSFNLKDTWDLFPDAILYVNMHYLFIWSYVDHGCRMCQVDAEHFLSFCIPSIGFELSNLPTFTKQEMQLFDKLFRVEYVYWILSKTLHLFDWEPHEWCDDCALDLGPFTYRFNTSLPASPALNLRIGLDSYSYV